MNDPNVPGGGRPVLCIRDPDGTLFMATPLAIQQSAGKLFRYTGDPNASLEVRLRWLAGFTDPQTGGTVREAMEKGAFNVDTASDADLIEFASEEFGVTLPKTLPTEKKRNRIKQLALEAQGAPPQAEAA